MTLDAVLDLLACPRCRGPLCRTGGSVRCPAGHAYDPARQGYLNLLGTAQPRHADTTDMVEARTALHATGVLAALTTALTELDVPDDAVVVDCGAGPGVYLSAVVAAGAARRGLALDISVAAARRSARAHPRVGAVVADTWQRLPVADQVADLVLCVFAPRNPTEFARILKPGGQVVVVTPLPDHLVELRDDLGLITVDPDKQQRLATALAGRLTAGGTRDVVDRRSWDARTARLAIAMGPNAFHLDASEVDRRIAAVSWPRTITLACQIGLWRNGQFPAN